jgi:hypothetical protein
LRTLFHFGPAVFRWHYSLYLSTFEIVNEAAAAKVRVNLISNNRAGGNAPLIAQKIHDQLRQEQQV